MSSRLGVPERKRFDEAARALLPQAIAEEYYNLCDATGRRTLAHLSALSRREAWEVLVARGLIPMSWVDDPRRRFVRFTPDSVGIECHHGFDHCPECDGSLASPASAAECLVFASDIEAAITAEAIARELTKHDRVMWRVRRRAAIERRLSEPFTTKCAHLATVQMAYQSTVDGEPPSGVFAKARHLLRLGFSLDIATDGMATIVAQEIE